MFGTEDLTGHIGKAFDRGVRAYRDDPAGFVRDCIVWGDGKGPAPYQLANLQSLVEHQRIAVRGPRGLGKTTTHAWVILWFALTRDACREDWKCIVTAGAWGQLVNFLWPEVKTKWTPRLDWERIGRKPFGPLEMMQRELRLSFGAVTMGAPTDAAKIEGAHADELLYVLDEAKSIPDDTWRSIEGAFSGAGADTEQTGYAIASSTPSAPEGYFYDIHAGAPGLQSWHAIHVTREQALGAKRMSVEWAQQQAEYFGEDSAWYRNHVEGEFATQESDSVIRMVDLEAAHERWRALNLPWSSSSTRVLVPAHDVLEQLDVVGVDVSRGGGDKTVYALRHGEVISTLVWRPREPDTTVCAREVASLLRVPERPAVAVVDANGVGGPVADMLRKDGCRAVDFVAQEKTSMKVRTTRQSFVDTRAGAWWNLRELLEPGSGFELAIPPDDQLTADLLAPTWKEEANGRIRVESKDGIRGRLKRSTDAGDACFVAGTLVATEAGPCPIEEIRVGVRVWTRDGLRPVVACGLTRKRAQVCDLELEDGRRLSGTPSHPIWDGTTFRALDTFVQADRMWVCNDSALFTTGSSLLDIPTATGGITASTSGPPRHSESAGWVPSTWRFTSRRSVRFLRAGTSIIETAIRWTTDRKILRYFLLTSTRHITPPSTADGVAKTRSIWNAYASLPKRGTPRRRGAHGTPRMASAHGKAERSRRLAIASDAASQCVLTSPNAMDVGGAHGRVSQNGNTEKASVLSRRSARIAAPPSGARVVAAPVIAPVAVRRVIDRGQRADVWNLAVAGTPEYFANGVLVHNCVQAYWTVKSAPMGRPPEVLRRPGGSRNAPFRQRAGAGMGH